MIWKRTGLCYQVQSNQDSIKGPSLFFPKLLPIIAFYPIIFLTPANILDSNHSPQRNKQIKSAITQITQEVLQIVCIWDIIWQILLILLDFAQMSLGSSLGRQGPCPSSLHKSNHRTESSTDRLSKNNFVVVVVILNCFGKRGRRGLSSSFCRPRNIRPENSNDLLNSYMGVAYKAGTRTQVSFLPCQVSLYKCF